MKANTRFLTTALGTAFAVILLVSVGLAEAGEPSLVLRISVPRSKFQVGQTIPLRIEFENSGKQPIYVGRHFWETSGHVYNLHLEIADSAGNLSPARVMGPGQPLWKPYEESAPAESDLAVDLARSLSEEWVLLGVGHTYGTTIEISMTEYEFLGTPGKYRIQARYDSRGFLAASVQNLLLEFREQVKKLPYASFEGEVLSNKVSVEIVGQTKPD